jgi:Ca2+-binding RTX toxin-like protein
LQHQYLWSGDDSVAMRSPLPNAFLKGGSGSDALAVAAGTNVLDGSSGSNLLVGGTGQDGGSDVFFLDARSGAATWSTIVNFHAGDRATIFGFHTGLSTMSFADDDGQPGFTGLTIHSEINGPGTGVTSSMTFAGIDRATVQSHFVFTSGALPGGIDYLMIDDT